MMSRMTMRRALILLAAAVALAGFLGWRAGPEFWAAFLSGTF